MAGAVQRTGVTAWALRGVGVVVWLLAVAPPARAADFLGQVLFNGQPVPGATVTATRQSTAVDAAGEKKVTLSDAQGVYRFPDLAEGMWTVQVEMFGFAPASRRLGGAPGNTIRVSNSMAKNRRLRIENSPRINPAWDGWPNRSRARRPDRAANRASSPAALASP